MTGRKRENGVRNMEQGPVLYRLTLGSRKGCPNVNIGVSRRMTGAGQGVRSME